jgi:hypothetical protein
MTDISDLKLNSVVKIDGKDDQGIVSGSSKAADLPTQPQRV